MFECHDSVRLHDLEEVGHAQAENHKARHEKRDDFGNLKGGSDQTQNKSNLLGAAHPSTRPEARPIEDDKETQEQDSGNIDGAIFDYRISGSPWALPIKYHAH